MACQRTAPGIITDQLMQDFHVTAATIGVLTSIQFFVYTSLQIPMGLLADRFGPNFFLIFGAILTGLGTIFYSASTHEFVLFFSRILTGVGDATIWVNMMLILAQWFHKKGFERLVGFAGMTGSLGFLLATVPLATVLPFLGWRGVFLLMGVLLCLCGLFLYFILIKHPKQKFGEETVAEIAEIQREKIHVILRRIVTNRQAWALFCCHFGVVGSYIGFTSSWAVPYGMQMYDMTRSDASQLSMIGFIGALLGAPLINWIASALGNVKKPYMIIQFVVLCSWLPFLLLNGRPPFYLLITLFFIIGFGYGASALTFVAARQSFLVKEYGIVSGFANTGGFLSAVLLPMIFGYLLDYSFSNTASFGDGYTFSFITPVFFSVIGLIGIFIYKEKRQR